MPAVCHLTHEGQRWVRIRSNANEIQISRNLPFSMIVLQFGEHPPFATYSLSYTTNIGCSPHASFDTSVHSDIDIFAQAH